MARKRRITKKTTKKNTKKRSTKRRNPLPTKSRQLQIGDEVWVVSGSKIEPGTVESFHAGYGDEKHRRAVVRSHYGSSIDVSEIHVWPTKEEAIKAQAWWKKARSRWLEDLNKQEAAELLQIDNDYRVDLFKAVDLWAEGHQQYQALRKFLKARTPKLKFEIDEGYHQGVQGITLSVIFQKLIDKKQAEAQAAKLISELDAATGPKWKLQAIGVESKVDRAIHDDDLAERYGDKRNPIQDVGSYQTGVWDEPTGIWGQHTEIVEPDQTIDYAAIKQVLLSANWNQIASLLSDPQIKAMKAQAIKKVLYNDPRVDTALRHFIDTLNDSSEESMLYG